MGKDGEIDVTDEEEAVTEVTLFLEFTQVQHILEEKRFLDDLLGNFRVNLKWGFRGLADNVGIMEREEEDDE